MNGFYHHRGINLQQLLGLKIGFVAASIGLVFATKRPLVPRAALNMLVPILYRASIYAAGKEIEHEDKIRETFVYFDVG